MAVLAVGHWRTICETIKAVPWTVRFPDELLMQGSQCLDMCLSPLLTLSRHRPP